MMTRLAILLVSLFLAGSAVAQTDGEEAKACVPQGAPPGAEYARNNTEREWPEEARRIKGHEQFVTRRRDTLRLAVDGRSVELQDCPYGDTAYQYLFERYDEAGRFYVLRTPAHEDLSYTLVMQKTGRLHTVYGVPVWANDKSRFLTIACSLLPDRGTLTVHAPTGNGLKVETETELPCGNETCSARWDYQSWISVRCTPREEPDKKGAEFVLLRGNDGTWKKIGR